MQPRILLRIAMKPMHGYELLESLGEQEHPNTPDTGGLYRMLRSMEQDGLLESSWETNNSGPARRIYQLTPAGETFLHEWVDTIKKTQDWLEDFLKEYTNLFEPETSEVK